MNSSVSGVVVDAGEGGTSIIPVVCVCCVTEFEAEGYVLGAAVKTPPPANSAVRHFLSFLKRQYPAEPADNE